MIMAMADAKMYISYGSKTIAVCVGIGVGVAGAFPLSHSQALVLLHVCFKLRRNRITLKKTGL
jgi:hypothetical protein